MIETNGFTCYWIYCVYNYVPPRLSEWLQSECFAVSVVPVLVFIGVPWVASFGVCSSGSFNPRVFAALVFVFAILIVVTDIEPMFGAIVCNLKPLGTIGVRFADPIVIWLNVTA